MLICFWDQDKVSTFRVIQSPYPYHTNPNPPIPHFLYRYKRHLLLAGRILHIFVWNRFPERWRISSMKFVRCNPPQKPFCSPFFARTNPIFPSPSPYPLPQCWNSLSFKSFRNFIYPLYLWVIMTQRIWLIPKFKISFFFSLRKTNFWTHLSKVSHPVTKVWLLHYTPFSFKK